MENFVPMLLLHLRMDVVTTVTKFCDFLRKQFHSCMRIAEYNTLIDAKFREQGIETVHFLALFNISIKLRQTLECELLH